MTFYPFWTLAYSTGSLVITHVVRVSVRVSVCPSLDISETKGYKSDRAQFLKKILGVMGENPLFGPFFMFVVHTSASSHYYFLKFHIHNKLNII